jgi:hypothetical protein
MPGSVAAVSRSASLAWERHLDETIRNLRELAAGRAERDWREKHGVEKAD